MAQRNTKPSTQKVYTHGGVAAYPHLTPLMQLRRSVLACLLWEDTFYEDGQSIADRIAEEAKAVSTDELAALAIEARNEFHLRHVPLLLLSELAKRGGEVVGKTIEQTIQRADELSEFMAIYWRDGKTPLSAQVKRGLAKAFTKFDAYQLAKYDRANTVRLRDVLFMVHAKPKDEAQAAIWKQLVDGTLPAPDTWEVALSTGGDKRTEFTRMLTENKLGYLALLRNLRNMVDAGVDTDLVRKAIVARKGAHNVLPFRYVAAARAAPQFEPALDEALTKAVGESPMLPGLTVVLVDVSASMHAKLSSRSELNRMDAAATLASVINAEKMRVFTFSDRHVEVPPRHGMAGVDAIIKSQTHSSTELAAAVDRANKLGADRLIVITDEQATGGYLGGRVPEPNAAHAYMVNVASYKNGVGYGKWTHIDGFSERILRYIYEAEAAGAT